MMSNRSMTVKKVLVSLPAAFVLLAVLGGCGFKTLPVAPQGVVPVAISDLRYDLSEQGVTLSWSYPVETITGQPITELDSFVVYRAVVPEDSYCETCPIPYGKPIVIPAGSLPGEGKKTATYEATLLRPGNLYFFQVRSKTGWLAESEPSNLVSFVWKVPPQAPAGLSVKLKDSGITLSWQPVTTRVDGTAVTQPVRYQVSRSVEGGSFAPIGEQVADSSYLDKDVQNSRTYFYRVQAFTVHDQGLVGGGLSESISATPEDRTPPAVPGNVKAVRTGNGVKVFWNEVKTADLGGYRVYRRLPGGKHVMIQKVNLPYTLFEDRKVPAGAGQGFYSVSSFDRSKPANESRRSAEVMIKY
jgi:hypothetical protein